MTRPLFRERRKFPRFLCRLPATWLLEGITGDACITMISMAGAQISLDHEATHRLFPDAAQPHPKTPLGFQIEFQLPKEPYVNQSSKKILIRSYCTLLNTRRISQTRYIVECHFEHFKSNGEEMLRNYIQQRLESTESLLANV